MSILNSPGVTDPTTAEPRRPTFREVPWRWSDIALVFAPVLAPWVLARLHFPLDSIIPGLSQVNYLFSFGWMIAYPWWLASRRGGWKPVWPGFRQVLPQIAIAVGFVVLSIMTNQIILIGAVAVFGEAGSPGLTHESSFQSSPAGVVWFTILAVSIGPVAEEFAFRGVLYNVLRRRLPVFVAVLLQGVLFGFYHPFSTVNQVVIATMGCVLGLIYEWRKTILTPILCHVLMNCVATVGMIVGASAFADGPALGVKSTGDTSRCQVQEVVPGTAAADAGLQVGDIITAVDDQPVANHRRLTEILATRKAGDSIQIRFDRGGESRAVRAVLKSRRESRG